MSGIAALLILFGVYLGVGFLFGLAFIWNGVQKIDANAQHSSWKFRLLLVPGSMLFWPTLLTKWIKS